MAIEYSEDSTGIYKHWSRKASSPSDMEQLVREFAETFNRAYRGWLDAVEAEASAILDDPAAAKPIRADAESARGFARFIRKLITTDEQRSLAYAAFRLGLVVERIHVRPFEPHAARGIKTLRSSQKGHEKTHGTAEEKQRRQQAYLDEWAKVRRDYDELKVSAVDAEVARRFGVAAKTIQRARLKKAPQN